MTTIGNSAPMMIVDNVRLTGRNRTKSAAGAGRWPCCSVFAVRPSMEPHKIRLPYTTTSCRIRLSPEIGPYCAVIVADERILRNNHIQERMTPAPDGKPQGFVIDRRYDLAEQVHIVI